MSQIKLPMTPPLDTPVVVQPDSARVDMCSATDCARASDPTTPACDLIELCTHGNLWVRRAAVTNPSTPSWLGDLLVRAGSRNDLMGTGVSHEGSITPWESNWLSRRGEWGRRLAARHPSTPSIVLRRLASDASPAIRESVAEHPNTPAESLGRLLVDSRPRVRVLAAKHPAAPREVMSDLIALGRQMARVGRIDDGVRGNKHKDTGSAASRPPDGDRLRSLVELGPFARELVASHPRCPGALLDELASTGVPAIIKRVLANPNTPAETLDRLLDTDDQSNALAIASHPKTQAATLSRLVQSHYTDVRQKVAEHRNTDPSTLISMMEDGNAVVRLAASQNPAVPTEELEWLRRLGSSHDLSQANGAPPKANGQQRCPKTAKRLSAMAAGGPWARCLAARHPWTPPEALIQLSCDGDPMTREAAMTHPSLPSSHREMLARAGSNARGDGYVDVDRTLSELDLASLMGMGAWGRQLASRHPNTPAHQLRGLATDEQWQVRREVARHTNTPADTLEQLARDTVTPVRWEVVRRKDCPSSALEALGSDVFPRIRCMVAEHTSVTPALRQRLRHDIDPDTRAAASREVPEHHTRQRKEYA